MAANKRGTANLEGLEVDNLNPILGVPKCGELAITTHCQGPQTLGGGDGGRVGFEGHGAGNLEAALRSEGKHGQREILPNHQKTVGIGCEGQPVGGSDQLRGLRDLDRLEAATLKGEAEELELPGVGEGEPLAIIRDGAANDVSSGLGSHLQQLLFLFRQGEVCAGGHPLNILRGVAGPKTPNFNLLGELAAQQVGLTGKGNEGPLGVRVGLPGNLGKLFRGVADQVGVHTPRDQDI